MDLSVVVPTLNTRDELADCLDALAENAPDAEIIVVNGPSADGTTGMVRDRADVDVLVELADRTINTARNAGIERAWGDAIAFVHPTVAITATWRDAVERGLDHSPVVTGPTQSGIDNRHTEPERRTIQGRSVSYFNPGNVVFDREPLDELDGFDEYLKIGGARDLAHRLAGLDYAVDWDDQMTVRQRLGADGGEREPEWGWKYRSLTYRLVKNYGLRPTALGRVGRHACRDGLGQFRAIWNGERRPSEWLGNGRDVVSGILGGVRAAVRARRQDRTKRHNPQGRSARTDRAVTVYDRRESP
jgi:glycosyltransferase involved in cell wall biosynthesis